MTLDEIAREAATELRTAGSHARYTVHHPSPGPRLWVLAASVAIAVAVAVPVMWWTESRPFASPTEGVSPDTPEALLVAVYAALRAQDDGAIAALAIPNARHGSYLVSDGATGDPEVAPGPGYSYDAAGLGESGPLLVEVTGTALVAGDALAVPVRYVYPDEVLNGFDVFVITTTPKGVRIAGGATFLGDFGVTPDPEAAGLIVDYVEAWSAGDPAAVTRLLADSVIVWDKVRSGDPATAFVGDEAGAFVASSLWFDVALTGASAASGPFVAVSNRLRSSVDSGDGISLFLIRDGRIFLHAFAM